MKTPKQTSAEPPADRLAKKFLALEDPIYELRCMTLLTALSFEALFPTESAEQDENNFVFTVQKDHFLALQFGVDEVNRRTREIHNVF